MKDTVKLALTAATAFFLLSCDGPLQGRSQQSKGSGGSSSKSRSSRVFQFEVKSAQAPADPELSSLRAFYVDGQLRLANTKGYVWKLGNGGSWNTVTPVVNPKGALLTANGDGFWEIGKREFRRARSGNDKRFEVSVFSVDLLTNPEKFTVLQYTKKELVGLYNSHIFYVRSRDNGLSIKTINAPFKSEAVKGGGKVGRHLWVTDGDELHSIDMKERRWKTDQIEIQDLVKVQQMALHVTYKDGIAEVESLSAIKDEELFVSQNISVADGSDKGSSSGKNEDSDKKDEGSGNDDTDESQETDVWKDQIKPIFDVSCLSCHADPGGYETRSSWVGNKCTLIDRLSLENKSQPKTMPPNFADPAQIEHMNANGDANRKAMLSWLETLEGECGGG